MTPTRIRDIVHDVIMETMYYHGTSSANAGGIISNGLNGGTPEELIGGSGEDGFESANGRSYMTSDYGNALRYGLMSKGNDDVHVFGFDVSPDAEDTGLDEDELGHYLHQYLNGKINSLAFDKKYLSLLTRKELEGIKSGNFLAYAATKKLIDRLTRDEINRLVNSKDNNGNPLFRNLTVKGIYKPTSHYTVRRPNPEERDRMTNYRKYGDKTMEYMRDYYMKNRKQM